MARTVNVTLEWKGPYTSASAVPNSAGIYMVLSGKQNEEGTWLFKYYKLLDIGQAGDLGTRLASHDREECWEEEKTPDHTIVFKYALMSSRDYDETDRRIVECCLRWRENPPCGEECNEGYTREDTVTIKNTERRRPLSETYTCSPPKR